MSGLLFEPFATSYLQRALIEALLLGVVGGIVGVHVVLRRLEFMTDTLTHTVFPGMAVAFLVGGSLLVGALVTGGLTAVLLTLITRNRRVTSDADPGRAAHGVLLGRRVLVSRSDGYSRDLTVLLFGRVLAVDVAEIVDHGRHRRRRAGRALGPAQGAGAAVARPAAARPRSGTRSGRSTSCSTSR